MKNNNTKRGNKKISPPFGYFGSKNKIALELCSNLPPHNCWVEAFCGSASLTLRKAPAPIEIINDIDGEIVNLFRQLRDRDKALCEAIELTPYAEQELIEARKESEGISDLERARRFLVQAMMAINGVFGKEKGGFSYTDSYTRNGHDARVNRWNNLPKRLKAVVDRLKSVRIENKDALTILKRFINRPATLVYLDPPYLGDRANGYTWDANDEEYHTKLLNLANQANCMIFISGYHNDLYDLLLSENNGWSRREIKASTKGSKGIVQERIEVVWVNKHYTTALATQALPIELTEKEAYQDKVNPERQFTLDL
ncbi:DNA adenine methylase [Parapedobacter lycopersici]|uniref:DNA adenine methylase n=1 Tax=Parapedobacter lycopersici TaxID=1864939 RepID=UPI00214D5614|nr:DNA adenine methylase [Parapedobacter lycopersici]